MEGSYCLIVRLLDLDLYNTFGVGYSMKEEAEAGGGGLSVASRLACCSDGDGIYPAGEPFPWPAHSGRQGVRMLIQFDTAL